MNEIRVSVVIKALNEEKNIARAIESALRAVERIGGEVILADSHSTDKTVEIAMRYPIQIVKLRNPTERCCGVGAQLGYQYARGSFIYILDGDMELHESFLEQALDYLTSNPEVAGVAGTIVEKNLESLEYQERVARAPANLQPGEVLRLDGGGLYRRKAIADVGHLTDRNLHSYEELDLAIRLRAHGWRLCRLPVNAVNHYGHVTPATQLLFRRWKNRYIWGIGEVLRAAIGKPHLKLVLKELKELWIYFGTIGWAMAMVSVWLLPIAAGQRFLLFLCALLLPISVMAIKKRSLIRALYSILSWGLNAAGLIRGFLSSRKPTTEKIDVIRLGTSGNSTRYSVAKELA